MKKVRGYVFSRSFMGENAPQQVQNMAIRDYCDKNDLIYFLSSVEYAMEDCFYSLHGTIDNLKDLDGIVFYSLLQMPTDFDVRKKIYDKIFKNNITIYFAIESMRISSAQDIYPVENILNVRIRLQDKSNYWFF